MRRRSRKHRVLGTHFLGQVAGALGKRLEGFEDEAHTKGDKTAAANILGISVRTLQRRDE